MKNTISKEWKQLKQELSDNIEKVKENGSVDKDTLDLMLNMLEGSKLKLRKKED